MSSLLDLQRRFRAALLSKEAPVPPEILGGPIAAATRLGVYRNNVISSLTGVLSLTYPAAKQLVGEIFFAAIAERFIAATPPISADLYEYGEGFADFIAAFEPAQSLPYLPDVMRLEWAVNRALHAQDAPSVTPEALLALPPAEHANLRFAPHPSLSLLSLAYPAKAIWEAVLIEDGDLRAARLGDLHLTAGREALGVLRGSDGLEVVSLSQEAFALAQALTAGRRLGDALLGLVVTKDAAPLLAELLVRGFFTDYSISEICVQSHEP